MKSIIIISIFLASVAHAQEKEIKKSFSYDSGQEIVLNLKFADLIKIEGWDKYEVVLEASVNVNNGTMNNIHRIEFTENHEEIRVSTDFGDHQDVYTECDGTFVGEGKSRSICSEIYYTIKVPENGKLFVESISGDVEIVKFKGDLYAKTISGFIDLSWVQQEGADILMQTVTGELYTDVDIQFTNKKEIAPMVGYELRGNISGGGKRLHLESISNDIFLRRN